MIDGRLKQRIGLPEFIPGMTGELKFEPGDLSPVSLLFGTVLA